ncbi:hypothetical protein BAUCODRAFT_34691 [Baudoinia panamericana UAMH 10762]|uniref:Uncharacterized protein n=1 Tax=Baudoinia panamericana (strain UAMH 10762) TaxID=717646 RepID=M2MH34_BAUPA|nr:uncharacterized protein BAUCODRAFT_34691 [Baudoinia panamericana UAMH 10762]EMC95931.1 hypothetical protein BAUCODRAFT_34691 [Baudoinia panamericana UAMH 10762]
MRAHESSCKVSMLAGPYADKMDIASNNDNCYYNAYGQVVCNNGGWYSWGRWLVLALVIIGAFLIFFLFS